MEETAVPACWWERLPREGSRMIAKNSGQDTQELHSTGKVGQGSGYSRVEENLTQKLAV